MSKKEANLSGGDILEEIEVMTDEPGSPPIVTSGSLEERLPITRRAISRRLNSLVEDRPNKLKKAKISNTNVYWKPEDEPTEIIPEGDEELLEEYIENQEGMDRVDVINEVINKGLEEVSRTEEIRTDWENREVNWWGITTNSARISAASAFVFVVSLFLSELSPSTIDFLWFSLDIEQVEVLGALAVSIAAIGTIMMLFSYTVYLLIHLLTDSRLIIQPMFLHNLLNDLRSIIRKINR